MSGLLKDKELPDLIDREELEDFVTNGFPDALGNDSDESFCSNQDEDYFIFQIQIWETYLFEYQKMMIYVKHKELIYQFMLY